MATYEALKMAEEQGLELVEVNPRAAPPVCRIMDFGKFKYETSKKEKASRKHQSTVVVKEVKFRPKTDVHDLDFKVKHIRRFLAEGNKCRLVIVFRGREIVHPETGQAMLDTVIKALGDSAMVEQKATMEGRRMVLTLGPRIGVMRPGPPPTGTAGPAAPHGRAAPACAAAPDPDAGRRHRSGQQPAAAQPWAGDHRARADPGPKVRHPGARPRSVRDPGGRSLANRSAPDIAPILALACRAVTDILRASHAEAEDEVQQQREEALQADGQRADQAQASLPPAQHRSRKASTGRKLRRTGYIFKTQEHQIKAMLPYGTS